MRRKKLKPPKYSEDELRGEYASTLKQYASRRTALKACLKLPSSPEAYSVVVEAGCEFLEAQRELDGMAAQVLFDYEREIKRLRAENKKLDRKNKGLLLELRGSMKLKGKDEKKKSEDPEVPSVSNETKRKRKRGAPVGHHGTIGPLRKMNPIYDIIANHIPKEKILNGDENGWKVRGKSGYIWIFCNKNVVYFLHDKSRAGAVPKDVLGDDYKGILICDFYGGYNFLKNTQRRLVHFLRDIKKQCEIYAGSKSLGEFKEQMKTFIKNGLEIQKMEEFEEKQKGIRRLGVELDAVAKIKLPKGDPEKLTKRILKYKNQMMLFVKYPGVEYHKNRAERHLRPMVIAGKNSFGSDTDAGAKRMCVLQSVVETCNVNNVRPFDFIKKIIQADPKTHNILTVPMLTI